MKSIFLIQDSKGYIPDVFFTSRDSAKRFADRMSKVGRYVYDFPLIIREFTEYGK